MTKTQITTLRNELTSLTSELRNLGVTGFSYPTDSIDRFTPSTLKSCIEWAKNLLVFISLPSSRTL